MSRLRPVAICCLLIVMLAAEARADWLVVPFFGGTFGGTTTLISFEQGAESSQLIFGASGLWLSKGLFGVEGDVGYAPRFFERDNQAGLVVGSQLSTVTGNLIVTVPLGVTRESLRPYVVGGLGLMHAGIEDVRNLFPVNENLLAIDIGGGAIGFVSNRTGVRFDLRHVRSVRGDSESLMGVTRTRLSFWRATIGVVLAY